MGPGDLPADVGAHAEGAAAHGEEGAFAAGGAARGHVPVVGVRRAAEDVVVGLSPLAAAAGGATASVGHAARGARRWLSDLPGASGARSCARTGRRRTRRGSRRSRCRSRRRGRSSRRSLGRSDSAVRARRPRVCEGAPMMVSMPLRQNWSLRETGRPCRGPMTSPCVLRYSSTSRARASARSIKISVRQFVCERSGR